MEHYGHGDIMVMDNWDIIVEQMSHHQFKCLALHGVQHMELYLVLIYQWEQSKLMELYGHGEIISLEI